jgi:UDP-glucose 4-epimerase
MILLTGGAGYIGSHACVALLEAGHDVVILDNLCNSSRIAVERIALLKALLGVTTWVCDHRFRAR